MESNSENDTLSDLNAGGDTPKDLGPSEPGTFEIPEITSRLESLDMGSEDRSSQRSNNKEYMPLSSNTPWAVENATKKSSEEGRSSQVRLNRSSGSIPNSGSREKIESPHVRKSAYSATNTINPDTPTAGKPTQRDETPPRSSRQQHISKHLGLDDTTPWATSRIQDTVDANKIKALKSQLKMEGDGANEGNLTYSDELGSSAITSKPTAANVLSSLKSDYDDCLTRLNTLPICRDTLRIRQERRQLEQQLESLETQIRRANVAPKD